MTSNPVQHGDLRILRREALICPHCKEPAVAFLEGYELAMTAVDAVTVHGAQADGPTVLHVSDHVAKRFD